MLRRTLLSGLFLLAPLVTPSITAQGAQVFGTTWGGGGDDIAYGAVVAPSGYGFSFAIAGVTTSWWRNSPTQQRTLDFLLMQLDSQGIPVPGGISSWGGAGTEDLGGAVIDVGAVPGIYLCGVSDSFSLAGNTDVVLVKYSLSAPAALQWSVRWFGTGNQHADTMMIDSSTAYLAGGVNVVPQLGGEDVLLIRVALSATGAPVATQAVVTWNSNVNLDDSINGGAIDHSSGSSEIVVAGNTMDSVGTYDVLLQKYDASLNLLWSRSWGTTNSDEDAYGMTLDPLGNIYVVGAVNSPVGAPSAALIMKWDRNGNLLWHAALGGQTSSDWLGGLQVDCSNNLVATGQTSSLSTGLSDGLMVKIGPNGDLIWACAMGASQAGFFGQAAVINCGDLIVPAGAGGTISGLAAFPTSSFALSRPPALAANNANGSLGTALGAIAPCSSTAPAPATPGMPGGIDVHLFRYLAASYSFSQACPAAPTSAGGPILSFDNTPIIGSSFVIRRTATTTTLVPLAVLGIGFQMPPLPLSNFGSTVLGAAVCINPFVTQAFFGVTSPTTLTLPIPATPTLCGVAFDVQWVDALTSTEIGSSALGRFVVGL